jgi:hypothetical protein
MKYNMNLTSKCFLRRNGEDERAERRAQIN